jgi:hypothetical protein
MARNTRKASTLDRRSMPDYFTVGPERKTIPARPDVPTTFRVLSGESVTLTGRVADAHSTVVVGSAVTLTATRLASSAGDNVSMTRSQ